jgi:capsular exopolysaccharide synthesis family protein
MLKEDEKVIMFTSSTSGEGKTFNAANLAVSFALLGKRVLLVGLDIRKPRLAELFEINDHHHGITTLLVKDNVSWEDVQGQILSSGINKNLDLLMAGPIPPNPTEIVSRQSFDEIFQILRSEYDYIIVDTAPVGLVTDTLQIGRIADVTCVICRADYTEKSAFRIINDFSINNKLPGVCIAINGIDMSKKKYGYAYGYGRYGKYGKYAYRGYGRYGKYGSYYGYNSYGYGGYGSYGYHSYGYGSYANSHYGNPEDDSVKK